MGVGDLSVRVVSDINDRSQHADSKFSCLNSDLLWSLYKESNRRDAKPFVRKGMVYDLMKGIIHNKVSRNNYATVYVAPCQAGTLTRRAK